MIEITPTFQYEIYNTFRELPGNKDTRLVIPYLRKVGKKITAVYKVKAYLPNPIYPTELL